MIRKIHGVFGGPRQKISPPRTKVDLSNMIPPTLFDEISNIETIVLSRDDKDDLVYSKFEGREEQQHIYFNSEDDITVENVSEYEETSDEDISSSTESKTIDEWLLKLSGKSNQSI